jgi:hypothetical protein
MVYYWAYHVITHATACYIFGTFQLVGYNMIQPIDKPHGTRGIPYQPNFACVNINQDNQDNQYVDMGVLKNGGYPCSSSMLF